MRYDVARGGQAREGSARDLRHLRIEHQPVTLLFRASTKRKGLDVSTSVCDLLGGRDRLLFSVLLGCGLVWQPVREEDHMPRSPSVFRSRTIHFQRLQRSA